MFIEEIKNCTACNLRQDITSLLLDKRVNNYQTFCHYYSKEDTSKARFLFIMQNPLLPKNWVDEAEYKQLGNVSEDKDALEIYRNGLVSWLGGKNKRFFNTFLECLRKMKLIDYSHNDANFKQKFLTDFIVTDLVKCRASTPSTNPHFRTCFNSYLKKELEQIGRNKLIFTFSSRTWDVIHETYFRDLSSENKIVKAHGKLFYSPALDSYFIPLAHFSGQQFSGYLRESYFEYFKDGLNEYVLMDKKGDKTPKQNPQ